MSKVSISNISGENKEQLTKFRQQLQLKAYSPATIATYTNEFMQLLKLLSNTPVHTLTTHQLRRFMQYSITTLKISENTSHSRINALKFYYEQVLRREKFFLDIPRPKKQLQIPVFLTMMR